MTAASANNPEEENSAIEKTRLSSPHETTFQVRWSDMDSLGHVNHASILTYFESARADYLLSVNLDQIQEKNGQGLALVSVSCSFSKPLRYPATAVVYSNIRELGKSSITFQQYLYTLKRQAQLATSTSVLVWIDSSSKKAAPLPTRLRRAIAAKEDWDSRESQTKTETQAPAKQVETSPQEEASTGGFHSQAS